MLPKNPAPTVMHMPAYEFCCDDHGPFTRRLGFEDDTATTACPDCGGASRRLFTPVGLSTLGSPINRAREAAAATAEAPAVVNAPVAGRTRRPTPVSRDPRHQKLPRPS